MAKPGKPAAKPVQIIAPDSYPQMLSKPRAARALNTLRVPETSAKAQAVLEAAMPEMRAAILAYVRDMEANAGNMTKLFEAAHEIRGFAETAGMITTGRIAEVLCRYMDDLVRLGRSLDTTIVALHVSAIARAARAEDDSVRTGQAVASELAALVAKRLSEGEQS
jgi:chemotaxis protein histidine kinase CheA